MLLKLSQDVLVMCLTIYHDCALEEAGRLLCKTAAAFMAYLQDTAV